MLTTKEAAKILFVGTPAIRRYIRDGIGKDNVKLKAIKIMNGAKAEWRISYQDLIPYKEKYLMIQDNLTCTLCHGHFKSKKDLEFHLYVKHQGPLPLKKNI